MNVCIHCHQSYTPWRRQRILLCIPCRRTLEKWNGGAKAHTLVAKEIRLGRLAHPTTLTCVDCGKPAQQYDHRDYNDPLRVDPVCRSCNKKRGPAVYVEYQRAAA